MIFHSVVDSGFVISLTVSVHEALAVLGLPQVVRVRVIWLTLGLRLGLGLGLG